MENENYPKDVSKLFGITWTASRNIEKTGCLLVGSTPGVGFPNVEWRWPMYWDTIALSSGGEMGSQWKSLRVIYSRALTKATLIWVRLISNSKDSGGCAWFYK